jgi:hypothetical protein
MTTKESESRYYRRNKEMVRRYKRMCGCRDCGDHRPEVLEFDHITDNKRCNVSMLYNKRHKLKAEIRKCQVVCGSCHKIRTGQRRGQ